MIITANSKRYEVSEGETVSSFIESRGTDPRKCVVEINGVATRFENFKDTPLRDGDVLEIMRVVAGG